MRGRLVNNVDINCGVVLLLTATCGMAVGNIYFPQAISPLVATDLGVAPGSAALVVTAAQVGYAAGIFLPPLAPRPTPRRRARMMQKRS